MLTVNLVVNLIKKSKNYYYYYFICYRKTTIILTSEYLIIQLKRFHVSQSGMIVKDDRYVNYPIHNLVINNTYLHLQSVIYHFGSNVDGGHYVAVIHNKNNKWIKCNDCNISEVL